MFITNRMCNASVCDTILDLIFRFLKSTILIFDNFCSSIKLYQYTFIRLPLNCEGDQKQPKVLRIT